MCNKNGNFQNINTSSIFEIPFFCFAFSNNNNNQLIRKQFKIRQLRAINVCLGVFTNARARVSVSALVISIEWCIV